MRFLFLWILPVSSVFCAFLSNQIRQNAQIPRSFCHTFRFLWYFRSDSYIYIIFYIPPFGRPMPTRNPAAAWLSLRGSWRAAPERGAREPLRHLLALLANAASPERGGKGPMPSPALGRRAKPGLAMPAPVWEIRFTGRHPQRDPSNTRRRSSGRRYGRWRPPECPDRTTRQDRRCPSTSSCPRADRTQTADRGRAHG